MKGIFKIVIYLSIVFSLVLIFTPSGYAVNTAPKKSGNAKKIEKSAGKNSRPVENPAEAFKITEIKIAGLKNISQSIVFLSITAKPGNTLTRELIDENLKRIYNIGYFNDKISADTVKTSGGACLVFNVTENPIVKNIVIKGNALFNEKTILDVMQTRRGNVFNHSLIASDAGSIQKLFDKNGYVMNRLKDINFDGETLYLIIEENRIERIKIAGNNKTRDRVIMRELKFRTGDIFDDKKVTKSLQKIFNLGYFSEVIPRCEAGSEPGKIDFIIEVKESKTGNYTTAGGYSSANGLVGSFEIEEKNLRGRGQTLNAMVEFGGRRSYSFGFTEPNVNGKNYSLGATVYNVKQDQKLYRTNLDPITYGESRNGFSVTSGR
ncbi:MAG TPA: POTRA domain-containing protein, partial [Candidatus Wallbacteria bacterium]|nr:POTRA domain-containing protein [Candidatus Wallbacteria bacterium]